MLTDGLCTCSFSIHEPPMCGCGIGHLTVAGEGLVVGPVPARMPVVHIAGVHWAIPCLLVVLAERVPG